MVNEYRTLDYTAYEDKERQTNGVYSFIFKGCNISDFIPTGLFFNVLDLFFCFFNIFFCFLFMFIKHVVKDTHKEIGVIEGPFCFFACFVNSGYIRHIYKFLQFIVSFF